MAGSEIETPTDRPTPKDCCVGTDDGQSYTDSNGSCVVPQCIGERSLHVIHFVQESTIVYTCTTSQIILCHL